MVGDRGLLDPVEVRDRLTQSRESQHDVRLRRGSDGRNSAHQKASGRDAAGSIPARVRREKRSVVCGGSWPVSLGPAGYFLENSEDRLRPGS